MKTLYESILGSTKSGKASIEEQIIEYVKSCLEYKSCFNYVENKPIIEVRWEGNTAIVNIIPQGKGFYDDWRIYQEELDIKPKELDYIEFNGVPTNQNYFGVRLKNSKELPSKVQDFVEFIGCKIGIIDSLPTGCERLIFSCAIYSGSKKSNTVKQIKNLNLKKLETKTYTKGEGLNCPLENIYNNKIDEMYICIEMLGNPKQITNIFETISRQNYLKEEFSNRITEFDKNNKIGKIIFVHQDGYGEITFDKQKNLWKYRKKNL